MGICGLCNGRGKVRTEQQDEDGKPLRDINGNPVIQDEICPRCDGWDDSGSRYVDEIVPSKKGERKGRPYVRPGGSRSYTQPRKNPRSSSKRKGG